MKRIRNIVIGVALAALALGPTGWSDASVLFHGRLPAAIAAPGAADAVAHAALGRLQSSARLPN